MHDARDASKGGGVDEGELGELVRGADSGDEGRVADEGGGEAEEVGSYYVRTAVA